MLFVSGRVGFVILLFVVITTTTVAVPVLLATPELSFPSNLTEMDAAKELAHKEIQLAQDWLSKRPEVPKLINYCLNQTNCDITLVLERVLDDYTQTTTEQQQQQTTTHATGSGTRPVSQVNYNQVQHSSYKGWNVVSDVTGSEETNTKAHAFLAMSVAAVVKAFTPRSVDMSLSPATREEIARYLPMEDEPIVFGETYAAKATRWRSIKDTFPAFEVWRNIYSNKEAGLDSWGGSSRICMDWLPYMFNPYKDSYPVEQFLDKDHFTDTLDLFRPDTHNSEVMAMKKTSPIDYEKYVQDLKARKREIQNYFVGENVDAIRSRMARVFDTMDGRRGQLDQKASELVLPDSDLSHCWKIMETALETKPLKSRDKVLRWSNGIRSVLLSLADGLNIAGSLAMAKLQMSQFSAKMLEFCPNLMDSVELGGFGLDDNFRCTDGRRTGSICWLVCGSYEPPVDADGRDTVDFTVCKPSGQWSDLPQTCVHSNLVWRQPYA